MSLNRRFDHITYELFGINPAEFYSQRFLFGRIDPANDDATMQMTISFQKIQRLAHAIRQHANGRPIKILEVGCGSGPIGARIKHRFPDCPLYGVDLSKDCAKAAMQNGFDEAIGCDVFKGLPYDDETFDFVFTMDFWGHIEFARKDPIVAECRRVTKKGGGGWHGIESCDIDYTACNPRDPEDALRKYVWMEGHIGVESLEALVERFSTQFKVTSAIPWPIRPFLDMDNVIPYKGWGEAFNNAIVPFDDPKARMAGNVVLGYCSEYILEKLTEAFGAVLTKDVFEKLGPAAAKFAEKFVQGSGFAMLTLQR